MILKSHHQLTRNIFLPSVSGSAITLQDEALIGALLKSLRVFLLYLTLRTCGSMSFAIAVTRQPANVTTALLSLLCDC